jgi:hypothetical protein
MFKVDPHTGSLVEVKGVRNIIGQYHYQPMRVTPLRPPIKTMPPVKFDVANELSSAFGGMLINRRRR